MDTTYAVELATSILIFAPGLVLLAIALFVGVLASLERVGLFTALERGHERVVKQLPAAASHDA